VRQFAAKGGVVGIPPEALTHLDAAINLVSNEKVFKVAGLCMADI